ncbi:MAG: phosphotransferase [Bacteroidales bacterium]|nr:phosphotransferase [Bacteroidales bacterium]
MSSLLNNDIRLLVEDQIKRYLGSTFNHLIALPLSGSNRFYFRVILNKGTLIATYNEDILENEAFFYLQKFFYNLSLPVPQIVHIFDNKKLYLQEDLGDTTLYQLLTEDRKKNNTISPEISQRYKQVIDDLIQFQLSAEKGLDFSHCYPVEAFDSQAIQWDLNYFKYMFLKLVHAPFNEKKLEEEFQKLIQDASTAQNCYFMFRDFQSRNIMIKDNKLYYIDFQGGRRGPIFYDIASLLFDAKAELPFSFRNKLIQYYISQISNRIPINKEQALQQYYIFVFIRILQALGAYGYRGLFEQKEHFIKSFAPAFKNLKYLFKVSHIKSEFPYIASLIEQQFENPNLISLQKPSSDKLTVTITSFAYKNGYPIDSSGNGGGFAFDCRALPNPGKIEHLKHFTGKDSPVKEYMEQFDEVKKFISACQQLVEESIKKYIERNFEHLMVNFGCTGGQHRSVYCAEKLAKKIREKFDINIKVIHTNQQNWELK